MKIRIRSDPLIFVPPDPVLFSMDADPTCNNGFIKLFLSCTKYKSESTNSSIKWWVIISNFIPTYLRYKYIFFFISISGRIRIWIRNIFPAELDPDPDPWKKCRILIPGSPTRQEILWRPCLDSFLWKERHNSLGQIYGSSFNIITLPVKAGLLSALISY